MKNKTIKYILRKNDSLAVLIKLIHLTTNFQYYKSNNVLSYKYILLVNIRTPDL